MHDSKRVSITSCVSLLEQSSKFHFLSIGLTMSASIILLAASVFSQLSNTWFIILFLVILLGAIEVFYAIRVGFDKRLLALLVIDGVETDTLLTRLDEALTALKLLPKDKAGRDISKRLLGCIKLFKLQLGLCYLQLLVVVAAAVFAFL